MSNAIAASSKKELYKERERENESNIFDKLGKSTSLILIAVMFVVGSIVALLFHVPVKSVMSNYSYDVLVILIIMELFTI